MWFIGVEVEQETSAPPPKKNPGSAPEAAIISTNLNEIIKSPRVFWEIYKFDKKNSISNI